MNKAAIKNFAIWARNKLIADISYRAGLMGITEKGIKEPLPQSNREMQFFDIGTAEPYSISGSAIRQREKLVAAIEQKAKSAKYEIAYKNVMEEVAYTWFNRLIAIRFMEINDYMPAHVRVLSSDSGKMEPDIVTTPFDAELDFSEAERQNIIALKTDNQLDELFRLLFIKQCNALNAHLPALFEKTEDYTELLLNLSVIDQDGVVYHLVHDIDEVDFDIRQGGQVEIIGWLYQYYNTEPFAELYEGEKATNKLMKTELPYATQLFTPDWIVKYMVENALGRVWVENYPEIENIVSNWEYYLREEKHCSENLWQFARGEKNNSKLPPEDITIIDPCMGSGHMLVCCFDVLMNIYESAGYSQRDAAKLILKNNLYGLDIDDRAFQLAYFALMMKARQYNRRIMSTETVCHVHSICESNGINRNHLKYFGADLSLAERNNAMNQIRRLLDLFCDAKEYGSILKVDTYDWGLLRRFTASVETLGQMTFETLGIEKTQELLKDLVEIGEILARKYHVVVTNPPYLNANRINGRLSKYIGDNYLEAKQDMFMVMYMAMIKKNLLPQGYISFITPTSWMYSSKFKKIRELIVSNMQFISLVDCGTELFEGKIGHLYIVAWVSQNIHPHRKSEYVNLTKYCYGRREEKPGQYFNIENRGYFDQNKFKLIDDTPVAYGLGENTLRYFETGKRLDNVGKARQGLTTSDNNRFLRNWYEISFADVSFDCKSCEETTRSNMKWFPFLKGGDFLRWRQRKEFVVNYANDGYEIKQTVLRKYSYLSNPGFVVKNTEWYFKCGITWNDVAGDKFNARYTPEGYIFADASPCFFPDDNDVWLYLAYFNSYVFQHFADVICQGLHYSTGQIPKIPYVECGDKANKIRAISNENYNLSNKDDEYREETWDFQRHPLLPSREEMESLNGREED